MSLSKKEIHRLVDSLPDSETQVVKRFIEFVLMQPHAHDERGERQLVALDGAARVLQLTTRKLRQLIRDGVIPARCIFRLDSST